MNKVSLIGRLVKDPIIRSIQREEALLISYFTLAVNRRSRSNDSQADFINCIAFGRMAELVEKYYHKGMKVAIVGHLQTGRYENREGQTIYTTSVVVEEQEFVEKKAAQGNPSENHSDDEFIICESDEIPFC